MVLPKGGAEGNSKDNKRLLFSLMEPTIEFIMQCIFKDVSEVCTRGLCSSNACLKQFMSGI